MFKYLCLKLDLFGYRERYSIDGRWNKNMITAIVPANEDGTGVSLYIVGVGWYKPAIRDKYIIKL